MLRVGIANTQNANSAFFTHQPSINLHNHVRLVTATGSEDTFNTESARIQAQIHSESWQDLESSPPWRVVIVRPASDAADYEDIIFFFHHALLDGMSSKLFHKHLLKALNSNSTISDYSPHKLTFETEPALPIPQEEAVPSPMSALFMARTLWRELAPASLKPAPNSIWSGKNIDYSLKVITRIIPIDISAASAKILLAACKEHGTTLTGLLHALMLFLLSKRFPNSNFSGATPISLRPYAKDDDDTSKTKLRNLVTTHAVPFNNNNTASASDDIWATATYAREDIAKRVASLPGNDTAALSKYVRNWNEFFQKKNGTQRPSSWEVSNVGVLAPDTDTAKDAKYKITRILFSNAGMPTGAAVSLNVASVAGGSLGVALSWQERTVEDELVEYLAKGLQRLVESFCDGGEFLI
jgi:hypothetical protein